MLASSSRTASGFFGSQHHASSEVRERVSTQAGPACTGHGPSTCMVKDSEVPDPDVHVGRNIPLNEEVICMQPAQWKRVNAQAYCTALIVTSLPKTDRDVTASQAVDSSEG